MRTILSVCIIVALLAPLGFAAPACDCVLQEDEQSCLLGHLIDVINKLINCQKQPISCITVEGVGSANKTKIGAKEENTSVECSSTTNTKGPLTSSSLIPTSVAHVDHEYITTTPEVASSTTTDEPTWSSSTVPTNTPAPTTSTNIHHDYSNSSQSTKQNPFSTSTSSTTTTSTPISTTVTANYSNSPPATQEVPIATSTTYETETTSVTTSLASATSLVAQSITNDTSTSTTAPSATISRNPTVTKKHDFIFIPVMKVDDDTKPFDLVQVLKCLFSREK